MSVEPLKESARRGRPPRISREAILATAADMLAEQPATPFSLSGLARTLSVTPMAIYTYFGSSNDLLQALTEHMLSDLVVTVDAAATPAETIAAWAHAVRAFFLRYPQLIMMLTWEGGNTSVAWFDRSALVIMALKQAGQEGPDLARATLWVWSVIMGAINAEIRDRAERSGLQPGQLESLDEPLREPVGQLLELTARPDHLDSFFEFQVARLLDALAALPPSGAGRA